MKKKLSLILCLVVMALGLAACGTDPTTVDYYGKSYDELRSNSENNIAVLAVLSEDELARYASYTGLTAQLVESWSETTADLGAYQGIGDFSITKAQTTVTTEQTVHFENRDAILTFVYDYNYETEQLELTDVNTDLVYTLGEKMSKAGLNTLMGMGTVFCVLILISLIIYCFRFIAVFQNKGKTAAPAGKNATVVTQIERREEQQQTDDLELVAVISAAIAASTGTSTDSFVVRSIHRR
jgi:sodium pump decarboxylase gamma subunit